MTTLALVLAACAGSPGTSPGTKAGSTPAARSQAPSSASTAPYERFIALRTGVGTPSERIETVRLADGRVSGRFPVGVAASDWSAVYTTQPAEQGRTLVLALDPRDGRELRRLLMPGRWALPSVVPGDLPSGLSGDGRTLVLVPAIAAAGSKITRFALLATTLDSSPRDVSLAGDFEFDALSPSGSLMYLIERLGGAGTGHYQVRAFDVHTGHLVPGAIVDKRDLERSMEGYPVARSSAQDGSWVDTVYVRADGTAFVHQLDTADSVAICIDLPDELQARTPAEAAAWRLAYGSGGSAYAENARLGVVLALDQGGVTAMGRIVPSSNAADLALAPDGRRLYLAGPDGVEILDTGTLATAGRLQVSIVGAGLAISPDSTTLYAVSSSSEIVRIGVEVALGGEAKAERVAAVAIVGSSPAPVRLAGLVPALP